jgi:hypothetical protein
MKFTSAILSLAALFSVASAAPTPQSAGPTPPSAGPAPSSTATVVYNSKYDSTTTVTSVSETSIFVGGVSPNSPWNSGSCLQITVEETDVYITITDDEGADIDIIEVSSDCITEFVEVAVLDVDTEELESVTFEVVVVEVDESFCVSS